MNIFFCIGRGKMYCPNCGLDVRHACATGKCETICPVCACDWKTTHPVSTNPFVKIIKPEKELKKIESLQLVCPSCGHNGDDFSRVSFGVDFWKCPKCKIDSKQIKDGFSQAS